MIKKPKVIFEDEQILVIDKPSGWITNEVSTTGKTPVIQAWIRDNYQFPSGSETLKGRRPILSDDSFRNGIVHRLDKETSGVLVIAKTKEVFEHLQGQFKERKVKKTYTALVHGIVDPKEDIINAPVGRLPWNRERFGVLVGGRHAETGYEVLKYYRGKKQSLHAKHNSQYTLLKLYPKTGRTHQIRIHLKHIGYPIVSDEFYAGRKTARADREWCPRLFLHASGIEIEHPANKKQVAFKSELPEDLEDCFKFLEEELVILEA